MTAVYKAYVWQHGKLRMTAEDIVAETEEQAAARAISALRSRPGMYDDDALKAMASHIYVHTPWPDHVTLQVVKEAAAPKCAAIVYG